MSQLPLPISPADLIDHVIRPALLLLPARMDTRAARVMLVAIAGQESSLAHRWQVVDRKRPEDRGPARGLWQFERGGGVRGVLTHPHTRDHARRVCHERDVISETGSVFERLEHDDVLAAAFARLLLWADSKPLPEVGQQDEAWRLYVSAWRPGAPHPDVWPNHYATAVSAVYNAK